MLLASFDRLLLANGYENLTVRMVAVDAGVGRSTFYEHFDGKDDLLEYSVAGPLAAIAAAASEHATPEMLLGVLTHVRAQRSVVTALLHGSTHTIVVRALARKLERHLAAHARVSTAPPIAPLAFLAVSLAHAQLGAIEAWLSRDDRWDVNAAARVLHSTTRAGVAAAFGPP